MRAGQQLEAFSTTFGLVASVVLHLAAFAYIASATAGFEFEFALTLPAEVEFGLTDEMQLAGAPVPVPPKASGALKSWAEAKPGGEDPIVDAGVPEEVDADVRADSGPDADADTDAGADAAPVDASATPSDVVAAPSLTGPSRLPPGAQLALRIDLRRVRESPLGPDVTRFLRGVPDWQLILDGSGIDPVADLDRLLLATPNLQRSKLVLAGKHRREQGFSRSSVKRLARSRGKAVRWQQRYGVATAPWYNVDTTSRTIALLSPQHFSITRRQDLQRVLAMVKARELRDADDEGLVAARGPDALLSMGPGEAISLEIEGVHRFIVGSVRHVPARLRLAVRETGANEATVSVRATYETTKEAEEASLYWRKVADFYSGQLIMSLSGFGKTLRRMSFEPSDERVEVSFKLNADQIRFILSYAEGRLQGSRPPSSSGGSSRPTKKGP